MGRAESASESSPSAGVRVGGECWSAALAWRAPVVGGLPGLAQSSSALLLVSPVGLELLPRF